MAEAPKNSNKPITGGVTPQQPPTNCPKEVKGCLGSGGGSFTDWWPYDTHPDKKKYTVTFQITSNQYVDVDGSGNKCKVNKMCDDYITINNSSPDNYCDNNKYQNIIGWRPNGGFEYVSVDSPAPDINDYISDSIRWYRGCCAAKVTNIEEIIDPTTNTTGTTTTTTTTTTNGGGGNGNTNCNTSNWSLLQIIEEAPTTNDSYDGSLEAKYNNQTPTINDFKDFYWILSNGNKSKVNKLSGLIPGTYTFYIEDYSGCTHTETYVLNVETTPTEGGTTPTTPTEGGTTPTPTIPTTTITLNETPLIIDDCQDLLVSVKLYFSQPSTECATNSITASLLPDNPNFSVEQLGVFDSDTDGFGNWVDMGIRILSPNSGDTFNINLNFIGLNDCCEYDIRVDNISVDCYSDEQRIIYDSKKCPGFELRRVIDNKKSWVYNPGISVIGKSEEDNIVRNRGDRTLLEDFGFVNRTFAPSSDADLPWRYTDYYVQSNILEPHSNAVLNNKELVLTFNMCADCCYEYSPCPKGFTLSGGTDICYSGTT